MEIEIFQYLFGLLTAITDAFITDAAAGLIERLRGFAIAGVAIYITLMGMSIMFGAIDAPGRHALWKMFIIVAIMGIALTLNIYLSFVVAMFDNIKTVLAQSMGQTSGGIAGTLDANLARGLELASLCMQRAADASTITKPWGGLGWNIAAVIIMFCGGLIMAVGGAAIAAAELLLAICFAFGPLFILLLIWPITARFFSSWFSACVNYVLVIVVVSVVMSFAMLAFSSMVGNDINDEINPLAVALEVFVLTVFLAVVFRQLYGFAASLSGGMSMQGFSITGAISDTMKPASIARNVVDAKSQRRDPESGQLVTARRHSHILDGRTVISSKYRQHVMKNTGKNWSGATGGKIENGENK